MKIRIVMVGRLGSGAADRITADYLRRLRRFCTVELVGVRAATGKSVRGARRAERETRACLEAVAPRETVAALDPAGELVGSDAFARWLGRSLGAGNPVAFLVGGAEGLTDAVRERADRLLSLSPMTLPHELARAVLAEQLYRAFSILRGTPYAR